MRNPFRSEGAAFRFVWLTIGYCALVVIGSLIGTWVGVAVFVALTALVAWWAVGRGRGERPVRQAPPASPPGERRILVIANEVAGGTELLREIRERSGAGGTRVLVVCPALNSKLEHWTSDDEDARAAARERLEASVAAIRSAGVHVSGEVGDEDPLQAVEDALGTFRPDELIVVTHPPGRSNWLERDVVERARERFALPLTHVVVDLDADLR